MFANTKIDLETLPKAEIIQLQPISKRYIKIIFINIVIQYSVLFSLLITGKIFISQDWVATVFPYALSALILLLIFQSSIAYLEFFKRGYALRMQDIIYAEGLLSHERTTVPFIRIQHLEIKQSFIAKKLHLASLFVYTAGESGGDLSIKGLELEEANKIHGFLTLKMNE